MAVGLTTGKVDLIRLEAGKQAQQKNILSSGPTVTLPIRNSRSCNALAFSDADPNYLAVGLDKVRGASSLIIWDISTFTSSLTLPITSANNATPPSPRRPHPQIPKLDNQATSRMDHFILQRHAPTEVVSALSFLPSSTHLLFAGISHRWLRLFDLRSQTNGINVASKVNGIATDPFDPLRVACFGDGIVNVWDARKLQQPLLTFTERDANTGGTRVRPGSVYANIEFSSTRRGCLAALEKDSTYVRFWDLLEVKMHSAEERVTGGSTLIVSDTRRSESSLLLLFYFSTYLASHHTNLYQLNTSLGRWPRLLSYRIPMYSIRWLRMSWSLIRMEILNSMLYTTLPNNLYGARVGIWQ